jgi:hypothetical protein
VLKQFFGTDEISFQMWRFAAGQHLQRCVAGIPLGSAFPMRRLTTRIRAF